MKIDRLLSIIVILLNREKISATELSEKFGVSVRTIYRDIDNINLAGIPIISYSGNNGGFGILKNYKLDRQIISFNDMIHIINTLTGINKTLQNQDIELLIEKVKNIIPDEKKELAQIKQEEMIFDINPWFNDKNNISNYKIIYKAISEQNLIKITYNNLKNELYDRIVEPLSLFHKSYSTYLIAYCREKSDFRMFKLTRITDISVIKEKFTKKQIPSNFITNFENINNFKTEKIILKLSNEIKNRINEYSFSNNIEYYKNYMIAVFNFPEDQWLYSFILSFGDYAEVIEPVHIREIIREKINNLKNIYQS